MRGEVSTTDLVSLVFKIEEVGLKSRYVIHRVQLIVNIILVFIYGTAHMFCLALGTSQHSQTNSGRQ